MPRPKTSKRAKIADATRQQLLDAAAEEFAREGYVGANINRISLNAGFAKGTVYNYFAGKRALMLSLIDHVADVHLRCMRKRIEDEGHACARLTRFFEAGFDFVREQSAQARVMINCLFGPDAEYRERLAHAYQPVFQLIGEEIVATGIQEGVFRPLDPAQTSALLMTFYMAAGSQVDEEGAPLLDAALAADFALYGLHRFEHTSRENVPA